MSEKELNLDETIWTEDLSSIDLSWDLEDSLSAQWGNNEQSNFEEESNDTQAYYDNIQDETNNQNEGWDVFATDLWSQMPDLDELDPLKLEEFGTTDNAWPSIDETLFLDEEQNSSIKMKYVDKDTENFWKYLRAFFFSSLVILLWLLAIIWLYSFNKYISLASQSTMNDKEQKYVNKYRENFDKIKTMIGKYNIWNYQAPWLTSTTAQNELSMIVSADDIDYIDKKNILSPYVSSLAKNADDNIVRLDSINKEVAKQWFLPEELDKILSEDQAIDTIQRSLNALEVIKFSTAARVFSYMDSALQTISDMVRIDGSSPEAIKNLLTMLSSRWEKDISAYVYMCYLNPFEIGANCDTVGDLDLYYKSIRRNSKDDTEEIDLWLFKNSMNAINQLLEKEDTALFSITFNGFNAQDKNITFNIEVYTNQNDEKSLMAQWKRNPNIFILTNIVNLLKQSSFIIWSEINTKEVNVETRSINLWWLSTLVNYSSKDFTVPIQKDTEREIFDYIDLDWIIKMLKKDEAILEEEYADIQQDDWSLDESSVSEDDAYGFSNLDSDEVETDLIENEQDGYNEMDIEKVDNAESGDQSGL